jgi:hypothetical protein
MFERERDCEKKERNIAVPLHATTSIVLFDFFGVVVLSDETLQHDKKS